MHSFLSGRQSSRSQHHKQQPPPPPPPQQEQPSPPQPQQQQQQQEQQQTSPFSDPAGDPAAGPPQDSGLASDYLPAFDNQRTSLRVQQAPAVDEQQFMPQRQDQPLLPALVPGDGGSAKPGGTSISPVVPSPVGNSSAPTFDGRPLNSPLLRRASGVEYLDPVSRSQSQRFPAQTLPPQNLQQYGSSPLSAASVDDLNRLALSSPLAEQAPPPPLKDHYSQQHQRQPGPPPPQLESRRTTRKLIKNFLGGGSSSSRSHPQQQQQKQQQTPPPSALPSAASNTAGLGRRPSKRLSQQQQPLSLRTDPSQLSISDQQADWPLQAQQQPPQRFAGPDSGKSPHQGPGDFVRDSPGGGYSISESNSGQQPRLSIRRVGTGDVEQQQGSSPYGPDDTAHQGGYNQQVAGHILPEHLILLQQRQGVFARSPFETPQPQQQQAYPAPQFQQQSKAVSTGSPHQGFIGHLSTAVLQQQQQQQQQHHPLLQEQPNPETISQVSHESPAVDADQLTTGASSSAGNSYLAQDLRQIQQGPPAAAQDSAVAPPPPVPQHLQGLQQQPVPTGQGIQDQQNPQSIPSQLGMPSQRRSQDVVGERGPPGIPSRGQPPFYRHQGSNLGGAGTDSLSPLPPLPAGSSGVPGAPGAPPPGYRSADQRQYEAIASEDRGSPQPPSDREAAVTDAEKSLKDLAMKYKNVKRLYFDGKIQVDQLTAQIEHLQNAIANQRMSQSRTALDDNEYATRFNRLNGAINNLSFNIRKDWVRLPGWIEPYASPDAIKTGKQEMTAVGRSVISRWVMDSVFSRCFHPGLDPSLSRQLKEIEQNIRRSSYTLSSQEEYDALTYKIVSWRMATLEGLQEVLSDPSSHENRAKFTLQVAHELTEYLHSHMSTPPPPGVDGSASMIVELAISIASNLPMESRDVAVTFPLPLDNIAPHFMEVEKVGLPSLDTRPDDGGDQDDEEEGEGVAAAEDDETGGKTRSAHPSNDIPKVRFAGFVAVEVRGRQVLTKAPVWSL